MPEDKAYALARCIAEHALTKKAQNVCLLDLRGISSFADFFVICHGESNLQVKGIADAIQDGMAKNGIKAWHREGHDRVHWVLLDYVDVVVHVFLEETRAFYGLERLWGDSKIETITD